jgi:hypothetical protein
MLASSVFRMTRPPLVVGGSAMMWGYLRSWMRGAPRYEDLNFRTFLRRYQWACLVKGKRRATEEINARQAEQWRQSQKKPVVSSQLDASAAAVG